MAATGTATTAAARPASGMHSSGGMPAKIASANST
jgi:hypothetical protein